MTRSASQRLVGLWSKKLKVNGVHLTSQQFNQIQYAKQNGLKVICSTHSLDELKIIEKFGADYATFSPIFLTPNKGKPKGIKELKEILKFTKIKIFALGGIVTKEHINQLEKIDLYGFASIRYFLK